MDDERPTWLWGTVLERPVIVSEETWDAIQELIAAARDVVRPQYETELIASRSRLRTALKAIEEEK